MSITRSSIGTSNALASLAGVDRPERIVESSFEFVEEVQVKTGGYEAEFGRSTGGVLNMVTKSGSKLRKALESTLKKFPAATKALKKAERDHKAAIAEAKKLEKKKKYEEAVEVIDKVRFGDVRVTKSWEKAYSYGQLLAQKAERAMEKGR